MIITKLMGGLGNQLFEYAFARTLSLKHNTELKVDASGLKTKELFQQGTVRELELNKMGLNIRAANELELAIYNKGKIGKGIDLVLLSTGKNKIYVRERSFEFDSKYLNAPADCYLDGYWQSEKYFSSIRKELLKELSPKILSPDTRSVGLRFELENAVSIHVRRGDYISIPENKELYAECDAHYYRAAIAKMNELHTNCSFYVFSDEIEWFKNNVGEMPNVKYVSHNRGGDGYQDLYLMSLCKHNIIANSSFSWWGAWLNKNEKKTVIAPKNWFKNNLKDTKDLIPDSWIKL